jgi:hypothetical protein
MSGILSVIAWILPAIWPGYVLPFWSAAAFALLVACFTIWLREYKKSEPKLVLRDKVEIDHRVGDTHYRVEIENESLTSLEKCGVFLVESDPPLEFSSIPLHHSGPERPESEQVSLNHGGKAWFDVVRFRDGQWQVTGAFPTREFSIERRRRRLLLRAHGKDTPKVDKYYILEPDENGHPKLYPENDPVVLTCPATKS